MEKILKRILSVVLIAVVLAVSVCAAFSAPAYAASKPKLSCKSATVATGGTVTLKVKNAGKKVKWKTSNKSIAYVKSKKGKYGQTAVIKAGKKAGSCKITATVGKKKLTCMITTKKVIKLSKSTKDLTASVKAGTADRLDSDSRFTASAADFSFELLKKTIETDAEKGKSVNTLISPDSVLSALVMVENGARGQTLNEMQDALSGGISVKDYNRYLSGLNNRLTSLKTVKYRVANSIWVRKGKITMKDSFLKTNKTYHKAKVFEAPFNTTTVNDMNKWVSGKTNGMIKKIVNNLSPADKVVLINAIAFEGAWQEVFEEPYSEKFTLDDGTATETDMLHEREFMDLITLNGGKGFVKYYKGRQIAFMGLLPPEGSTVNEYLEGISGSEFVAAWKDKTNKLLDVSVPEFKYDYDASMVDPLKKMGMISAFSGGADFTKMYAPDESTAGLCIGEVLHKTHIELDREGTKAAAATAVFVKETCVYSEDKPVEVHLDRPFVYALVDTKTGIPLFVGILRNVK